MVAGGAAGDLPHQPPPPPCRWGKIYTLASRFRTVVESGTMKDDEFYFLSYLLSRTALDLKVGKRFNKKFESGSRKFSSPDPAPKPYKICSHRFYMVYIYMSRIVILK